MSIVQEGGKSGAVYKTVAKSISGQNALLRVRATQSDKEAAT